MGRPVFWCPSMAGDVLRLEGREAHHAAVVHRLRVGDLVRVTDGAGSLADGVVTGVDRRWVEVGVESRGSVVRPEPRLTVVQAVPKKERAELAVQALTEVGVDRVVPWVADRSQVRVSGERAERLVTKWRAWAHEASKQSRRAWFCEVGDVATTASVTGLLAASACPIVLHQEATERLSVSAGTPDAVLVVGPEGGITDAELAVLLRRPHSPSGAEVPAVAPRTGPLAPVGDVRAVRLGDTVLRTSTAGAVAAGIVLAGTRWH